MKLEFTDDARRDLFHAQDTYEEQREGLGRDFIDEMNLIAEKAAAMPMRFPAVANAPVRRARGKRFPYVILFHVFEDLVLIVGVLHEHQHPDTWRERS